MFFLFLSAFFGNSSPNTKGKRRFYICVSAQRKIAVWVAKKPDIIGLFAGDIYFVSVLWWERMDSNHRSEAQQIYSLPPLATRELSHIQLVAG